MKYAIICLIMLLSPTISNGTKYRTDAIPKGPVNNDNIKIPPFPANNPNNYQDELANITENEYRRTDGHIGDQFIAYKDAMEYIETIPNGRIETITRREVEKIRQLKMREDDAEVAEYFVMKKRILAPTLNEH
jgi:hypothetical protein